MALTFHCCRFLERYIGWDKFVRYGELKYWTCPKCNTTYYLDTKQQKQSTIFKQRLYTLGRAVTPQNYIGHYTTWCIRNSFSPLSYDILQEIFAGCETNQDYKDTLDALFEIQLEGFKLSFINNVCTCANVSNLGKPWTENFKTCPKHNKNYMAQNLNETEKLQVLSIRLKLRLELFKRVPTATNMLLAYNLIEEITLKTFSSGNVDMADKDIERFDKLKNLALGSKFIPERKLAFDKSVETFKKLTKVEI